MHKKENKQVRVNNNMLTTWKNLPKSKVKNPQNNTQSGQKAKYILCNNYLTKPCPLIAVEKPNNVIVTKIRHRRRL